MRVHALCVAACAVCVSRNRVRLMSVCNKCTCMRSSLIEKSRSQSLFSSSHHTLMRPHSYPRMLVAAVPLLHVPYVETQTCETRYQPQMKSTHEQYQIISRTHFPSASAHTIRPPTHTHANQLLSPKYASSSYNTRAHAQPLLLIHPSRPPHIASHENNTPRSCASAHVYIMSPTN